MRTGPVSLKPLINIPDGYETDKEDNPKKYPRCEYFSRYPGATIYNADVKRIHHYTRSEDARHYKESQKNAGIKFIPYPLTMRNIDRARARLVKYLAETMAKTVLPVELPDNDTKVRVSPPNYETNMVFVHKLSINIPEDYFYVKELKDILKHSESKKITFGELLDAMKPGKGEATGNSVSAHTGGFANPYHLRDYAKNIRSQSPDPSRFPMPPMDTLVYNELLEYKKAMCKYVIDEYAKKKEPGNNGKVNFSNDYPCILVRFNYRVDDKSVTERELEETYFKRYNYMLMAYFIAIVDYHAFKAGIEIEMVARSSFGHNNPTIDVTDKSFRINIGLIPKAYADIIVESLIKLYDLFDLLEDPKTIHLVMNPELRERLNLGRSGRSFKEPELPYTYWQALWVKGSRGDTGIKMIGELVERDGGYRSDLLANFVLNAIIENPVGFFTTPSIAEDPIGKLFEYVNYTEGKISGTSMQESLKTWLDINHRHWLEIREASGAKIESDRALCEIVQKLCTALCVGFPTGIEIKFLYKFLERANLEFVQNVRTRKDTPVELLPEWGSDSDTEPNPHGNVKPIYSKKVIVANGMMALNLAYYAAKVAISAMSALNLKRRLEKTTFEQNMLKKFTVNIENTYFETKDCLNAAINPPIIVKGSKACQILFFDLNSFNAEFIERRVNLNDKLRETLPQVVVLDHTSSTTDKISESIDIILNNYLDIFLILLVSSGLKNEQGGADNNPYGRMTIVTSRDRKDLRDFIYKEVTNLCAKKVLSDKALLPRKAHMIRHSYKDRRLAPRSLDFFTVPSVAKPRASTATEAATSSLEEATFTAGSERTEDYAPIDKLVEGMSGLYIGTSPLPKSIDSTLASISGVGEAASTSLESEKPEQTYKELAKIYENSFTPGRGWRLKYISEEGGVSGIRGIFVAYYSEESYATCPSIKIREELVTQIRDKLLLTYNGLKLEQRNIEVQRKNQIYELLCRDFINNLAKIIKSDRQELLRLFLRLFYVGMSQRDHGAIETLMHRDLVAAGDPNIKYLLKNLNRIIDLPEKPNPNTMQFCMDYLGYIRSRSINEGEEILQILAIILKRKISILQGNTKTILDATKDLPDKEYPKIYLDLIDVLLNHAEPLSHYNVILKRPKLTSSSSKKGSRMDKQPMLA